MTIVEKTCPTMGVFFKFLTARAFSFGFNIRKQEERGPSFDEELKD